MYQLLQSHKSSMIDLYQTGRTYMKQISPILRLMALLLAALLTGCGTINTLGKLEDGAGTEASKMWDRWVDSGGDIAVATTSIYGIPGKEKRTYPPVEITVGCDHISYFCDPEGLRGIGKAVGA